MMKKKFIDTIAALMLSMMCSLPVMAVTEGDKVIIGHFLVRALMILCRLPPVKIFFRCQYE